MDRMKTFGILALCVILFYIFSNFMINVGLKTSYSKIRVNIEETEGIEIKMNESRATYVNGYLGGTVSNVQNQTADKIYLKMDLYTKRNVCVGTKYVEISNLKQNETRDFRMGFRFQDVDYANISIVNEVGENTSEEEFKSDILSGPMLITVVIFLCIFG